MKNRILRLPFSSNAGLVLLLLLRPSSHKSEGGGASASITSARRSVNRRSTELAAPTALLSAVRDETARTLGTALGQRALEFYRQEDGHWLRNLAR